MRQTLVKYVPQSQDDLPPRKMIDSFDSAIIPLGSDKKIRDRYATHLGGVRIGNAYIYTVICKSLHTASFQFLDFQLKSIINPKPAEL